MPKINTPYYSQRDNTRHPTGTCAPTSLAMALAAFGLKGDGSGQLEDQVSRYADNNGIDYQSVDGLRALCDIFGKPVGVSDRPLVDACLRDIRSAIDAGQLCVLHTYSTHSGHVLVVSGYESGRFLVQDPWGEWYRDGYRNTSGRDLWYSDCLLGAICTAHSYTEAMRLYDSQPSPHTVEGWGGMWVHRIGRFKN